MRAPLALALATALALPLVGAHIAHDRPHIQVQEFQRDPRPTLEGTRATYDLELSADPFQDLIRHQVDASSGSFRSEYRRQPSEGPTAFVTTWSLGRIIEFRDVNANGLYEPNADTITRSWPFSGYKWNVTGPTSVSYGNVPAQDFRFAGTIANGPTITIETDTAGDLFTDEGARVLPQDMIVYLDVARFPARGLGDLFAFDGSVNVSNGGTVAFDRIDENTTAGLVARIPDRLAAFDWGAQATLDGVEQTLNVTIGDPEKDGARAMRIHFPLFDHSMHMVIVSGVEYVNPAKRGTDAVAPLLAASVISGLALLLRRRH